MANWYDKYLMIYGKPFSEVPPICVDEIKNQLARLQSPRAVGFYSSNCL